MTSANEKQHNGITSFGLHCIAMGLMLCDHLWGTFLGSIPWLGYLGRLAFPLFAFMLVEGFTHTGNLKKYALRLFIFALIAELPFNLLMERRLFNPFHQNVLWTFLISICVLGLYERIKAYNSAFFRLFLYFSITLAGYFSGFIAFVDYFGYGILTVSLFYFTRTDPGMNTSRRLVMMLLQLAGMYWINCEMMMGMMIPISVAGFSFEIYKQGFALLALPLIWMYNGRQGPYNKLIKNVYYWFYPAHMLILGALLTLL